eukprot:g16172.t1
MRLEHGGASSTFLLQPYRFWRCCGPLPGGAGQIEGEEVAPRDEATRLRIQLTKMGSAKVERLKIEAGDAAPEVLVNLRHGHGLARILARLENLSHILVWARDF